MPSDRWPLIYFLRHGQTDWNAAQRFQGQRDIPLNDYGRSQAAHNGKTLDALLSSETVDPNHLDWFCSPLGRTRETMEIARSQFSSDLPEVTFDDRLMEISFGIFEGTLLSDMEKEHPDEFAARNKSKWNHLPPKGENYDMLLERLQAFGQRLEKPSVVVAHGGVARALRSFLAGASGPQLDSWAPPQDQVMRFEDGKFELFGG